MKWQQLQGIVYFLDDDESLSVMLRRLRNAISEFYLTNVKERTKKEIGNSFSNFYLLRIFVFYQEMEKCCHANLVNLKASLKYAR